MYASFPVGGPERGNDHIGHCPCTGQGNNPWGVGPSYKRVFEKNKKSFWVSPFFKKAAFSEAFWKKLHQKPL
ncbi:hypothetical protein Gaha_0129_020 [Novacetimonas hansenii JCM 7643]|nr:hypothetical protein Gaha_0129_020 [Novacetimonas hansenii JCM 7643]